MTAHAQDAGECDRACLRQALDAYLAGVFKHDPAAARLTADHYSTLNTAVVHNGEGFWKDIGGYGSLQRRYFDPVNGAAAYLGLFKQDGKDVISSVRIKVEGGKVSEAIPTDAGISAPGGQSARLRAQLALLFDLDGQQLLSVGANHDASWIPTDLRCKDPEPNPIAIRLAPRGYLPR